MLCVGGWWKINPFYCVSTVIVVAALKWDLRFLFNTIKLERNVAGEEQEEWRKWSRKETSSFYRHTSRELLCQLVLFNFLPREHGNIQEEYHTKDVVSLPVSPPPSVRRGAKERPATVDILILLL